MAGSMKKRIKYGGPDMLDLSELYTSVSRIPSSVSVPMTSVGLKRTEEI